MFPAVCSVPVAVHDHLDKASKNFKYDDNWYYVNPVKLYARETDSSVAKKSSLESHVKLDGAKRHRSYTVIVRTGKAAGAGTAGPVYISLFSHLGCLPEQQLQVCGPQNLPF
jgi:hypothetical protein